MQLTPQSQATMLLTVSFGKGDTAGVKPLSNGEWARFAVWLRDHELNPASLLHGELETLLSGWIDRTVQISRIRALLDRGAALGFALEKWQRAGLWALTRSDREYPERLKKRLRTVSPPVLFGSGNVALLNSGGVAVVGSRDASDEELAFTRSLSSEAAAQGYSIVSGGARGVDDVAMMGALDSEGTVVGVLSDSLLRTSTSSRFRKPLQSGDLVFITPFNPEAGFHAGNAMARNRHIYCLADAAVIVACTPGKGGTWSGAIEAIKHGWVPLWVKASLSAESGNPKLAQMGARTVPDDLKAISTLFDDAPISTINNPPLPIIHADGVFDRPPPDGLPIAIEKQHLMETDGTKINSARVNPYEQFLSDLADLEAKLPMTATEISKQLGKKKSEVDSWIKKAVMEGKLNKLSKPVRYKIASFQGSQPSLFDDNG